MEASVLGRMERHVRLAQWKNDGELTASAWALDFALEYYVSEILSFTLGLDLYTEVMPE
jgi:hypothetical protein